MYSNIHVHGVWIKGQGMKLHERIKLAEDRASDVRMGIYSPMQPPIDGEFRMSALNRNGIGGSSHFDSGYHFSELFVGAVFVVSVLGIIAELIKHGL